MNKDDQNPDLLEEDFDTAEYDDAAMEDMDGDLGDDLVDDLGEEWDSGDQLSQPAKKKSSSTIIIMLVGVVAAAGVLYFQFLKPKSDVPGADMGTPAVEATDTTVDMPTDAAATMTDPAVDAPTDQPTDQGFMTDPGQVVPAAPIAPEPPQESAAPAEPLTPMPDFPTADDLQKADQPPPVLGETPAPDMPAPPPADPAAVVATPTAPETAPVEVPPADTASVDLAPPQPAQPASELPVVPTAPASPAPETAPVAPAPATVPATVPDSVAKKLQSNLDDANARIAALEAELNQARAALAAESEKLAAAKAAAKASPVASDTRSVSDLSPATPEIDDVAVIDEPAPQPVKTVAPARVTGTKGTGSKKIVATAPVRWQLRSAQDGSAMISKAGESDMRSIQVGETVPGLGRITAISKMGGGWVVQGTQSRLTQSGKAE